MVSSIGRVARDIVRIWAQVTIDAWVLRRVHFVIQRVFDRIAV